MDDLLQRGGHSVQFLRFTVGALMLLPIGYVYGKLVKLIPDAAGEVAYTARVFPSGVSFATGWMMLLAYFLTCPFEALAAGRITGYLFPSLNSLELYRLGDHPVYLPHLLLGLHRRLFHWLNCRGFMPVRDQKPRRYFSVRSGFTSGVGMEITAWRACRGDHSSHRQYLWQLLACSQTTSHGSMTRSYSSVISILGTGLAYFP